MRPKGFLPSSWLLKYHLQNPLGLANSISVRMRPKGFLPSSWLLKYHLQNSLVLGKFHFGPNETQRVFTKLLAAQISSSKPFGSGKFHFGPNETQRVFTKLLAAQISSSKPFGYDSIQCVLVYSETNDIPIARAIFSRERRLEIAATRAPSLPPQTNAD